TRARWRIFPVRRSPTSKPTPARPVFRKQRVPAALTVKGWMPPPTGPTSTTALAVAGSRTARKSLALEAQYRRVPSRLTRALWPPPLLCGRNRPSSLPLGPSRIFHSGLPDQVPLGTKSFLPSGVQQRRSQPSLRGYVFSQRTLSVFRSRHRTAV